MVIQRIFHHLSTAVTPLQMVDLQVGQRSDSFPGFLQELLRSFLISHACLRCSQVKLALEG